MIAAIKQKITFNAIFCIDQSWNKVSKMTIKNYFWHVEFHNFPESKDEEEILNYEIVQKIELWNCSKVVGSWLWNGGNVVRQLSQRCHHYQWTITDRNNYVSNSC